MEEDKNKEVNPSTFKGLTLLNTPINVGTA
jgi:hypothetical protein